MHGRIYTAPPHTGTAMLGKTLPTLLYDACRRADNPRALNQPRGGTWEPVSLHDFQRQAEETALGLRDLGLVRGDRVALFMESDVLFCEADMGCLIAGLVDVPVYLTHGAESIRFVIQHAGAKALFVSNLARLEDLRHVLPETPEVQTVIVAEVPGEAAWPGWLADRRVLRLEEVRARGRQRLNNEPGVIDGLLDEIDPHDLATIIYTSGTTGQPKGVMLSHENISYNTLTSFSGLAEYATDEEVSVSFLPLTHIFARTLHYGFLYYGTRIYFTSPDDLAEAFAKVRPTFFATVPRVLEKVYARVLEKATALTGVKKKLLNWALDLAHRYELGREPTGLYKLQLALADRLVFGKWREALGGDVKYLICGGAALDARLANVFAAAGVRILQGYGLTETSPVITFNRPHRNRAGTVGEPIPGVEVTLAEDGEILTRGPHVMMGYYDDEEKTAEVIDADGWFHTGDVGAFTDEGFLRITDRKKDLFKLSTGKYVMPQPLENKLSAHPLIEQAVVVGAEHKFCGALIFPEETTLRTFATSRGLDGTLTVAELVEEPGIRARYQELVDEANEGMDPWSTIKRFALVPAHLTIENGLLTPTLKIKRAKIRAAFADEIAALYGQAASSTSDFVLVE